MDDRGIALVKQIDHVVLRTDDVNALFALFTETLQLPVAWPIFSYRGFISGAVSFGAANLELLQPVGTDHVPTILAPGTRLIGLAFEPESIETGVAELDARGIARKEPWTYRLSEAVSWTNIDLDAWPDCPILLLVKYSRDQDLHRAGFSERLAAGGGGPLGVRSFSEVLVGETRPATAESRWQKLFDPLSASKDRVWELGAGPAVRLVAAERDGLLAARIGVKSLWEAAAFLERSGLLDASSGNEASLALPGGSDVIRFVQP
jgi:catechol 2,3-dioxygenase-like lactoylglutathione lyase family enzyme